MISPDIKLVTSHGEITIKTPGIFKRLYMIGCDFLKGAIYCFGGNRGNFTTDIATDTTMYRLDLSKNATMAELATNWTLVQPNTNGVTVESRKGPQFAKISDTQLVFSGGYGGGANNAPILDQTIVYDAETNSWSKYANYAEGSFGNRQMYVKIGIMDTIYEQKY